MKHQYTNELEHATSPYLLQHAHNPVNWVQWSETVTERAKMEDKLILVSIGYAACHWCHVMEHDSFEDDQVAAVMNEHFICVKVDREERPDIDHYYMTAVQLMQIQGGWPLNVIAMPDGRPIWGGTYFPKDTWIKNLLSVSGFYKENRDKTEGYASTLQRSLEQVSLTREKPENDSLSFEKVIEAVNSWKSRFDFLNGGRKGQPKFPMPVNLEFLLYFGYINRDKEVLDYILLTLLKMARGGIYDQIGGGFARYSVDEIWKVPHFEKMLYDNGQLLSIYSRAFQLFKKDELKTVVSETVNFLEREMLDVSGAFYSSLDADSDGEEGLYYVWKSEELQTLLKEDYYLFSRYYHVNALGLWEDGNNILLRTGDDEAFAKEYQINVTELNNKVAKWKELLLKHRFKRVRPGLDDKTLTSWNALVIQGLTDTYKAFANEYFLQIAIRNARFIKDKIMLSDGRLWHSWKKGNASISGFLEDYAYLIQAFISLFEVSGDDEWINSAELLVEYTYAHFHDKASGLFLFSEIKEKNSISNHLQNEDNVTPSSNSVMANNLFRLGLILGNPEMISHAEDMIKHFVDDFSRYPMAYSNWGNLILRLTKPFYEVAVCGPDSKSMTQKLQNDFYPNVVWAYSSDESNIPLLKDRFSSTENLIYICQKGTCKLPVNSVEEAKKLLQ